jgi:hypothetical protein
MKKMTTLNPNRNQTVPKWPGVGLLGVIVVAGFAAAGCGDYSRDDLLFAAAIPSVEDVTLLPPGVDTPSLSNSVSTTAQALDGCHAKRLRCHAQEVAQNFNSLTVQLLSHIDHILTYRPTERRRNGRVWGPYYMAEHGISLRFEMEKIGDDQFSHCLHFSHKDITRTDMWGKSFNCSVIEDESTGFVRVLSGTFVPGRVDNEAAGSGAGSLLFDPDRLLTVGRESEQTGVFEIAYDNFSEVQTISIDFEKKPDSSLFPESQLTVANYEYTRRLDSSGTFHFSILTDYSNDGAEESSAEQEKLSIDAQWNSDKAGRADATVEVSDTMNDPWTVVECWDASLDTTYFRDEDPEHEDIGVSVDDNCAL